MTPPSSSRTPNSQTAMTPARATWARATAPRTISTRPSSRNHGTNGRGSSRSPGAGGGPGSGADDMAGPPGEDARSADAENDTTRQDPWPPTFQSAEIGKLESLPPRKEPDLHGRRSSATGVNSGRT